MERVSQASDLFYSIFNFTQYTITKLEQNNTPTSLCFKSPFNKKSGPLGPVGGKGGRTTPSLRALIVRREALVYNSFFFFQNRRVTEIIRLTILIQTL